MSENKANGPDDAVASEMIKKLPPGEDLPYHEVFSGTLHGPDGGPKFVEECETGVLAETRRGTKEREQKLQSHRADISVEVVRVLCCSSSGKGKRTQKLERNCTWEGLMALAAGTCKL